MNECILNKYKKLIKMFLCEKLNREDRDGEIDLLFIRRANA